jgi:transcriptional regulator with XRE-family HTH domain
MEMTLHQTFCFNLRSRRVSLEMTQQEVAGMLDVRTPTYHNIESGRNVPSLTTIERVATVLEVQPSSLLEPPKYSHSCITDSSVSEKATGIATMNTSQ